MLAKMKRLSLKVVHETDRPQPVDAAFFGFEEVVVACAEGDVGLDVVDELSVDAVLVVLVGRCCSPRNGFVLEVRERVADSEFPRRIDARFAAERNDVIRPDRETGVEIIGEIAA